MPDKRNNKVISLLIKTSSLFLPLILLIIVLFVFSTARGGLAQSILGDHNLQVPNQTGIISGSKWNDLDGDSVWDQAETGIQGWEINLVGDTGVISNTLTDEFGSFGFVDLPGGVYTVTEDLQDGWVQTWPPAGYYSFLLTTGQAIEGLNFGNQVVPRGEIHGFKWHDLNGNGGFDDDEPLLLGWEINLIGENGIISSTTTDSNGDFWFTNLPSSVYTVTETLQDGWEQTWPREGYYNFWFDPLQGNVFGIRFGNIAIPDIKIYLPLIIY
jgi:hypothetical protein